MKHQGRTEDFAIDGALVYNGNMGDSAQQDCERRTFLGGFGRMLLREKFEFEVLWDEI